MEHKEFFKLELLNASSKKWKNFQVESTLNELWLDILCLNKLPNEL